MMCHQTVPTSFAAPPASIGTVPVSVFLITLNEALAFTKAYIGRRHMFGGWRGFYFALATAFMRTTRIARMLEHAERRTDVAG